MVAKYGLSLYPYNYFSPKDYNVGKIDVNDETYCIHHFDGKWVKQGFIPSMKKTIHKIIYGAIGRRGHNYLIHAIRPFINH